MVASVRTIVPVRAATYVSPALPLEKTGVRGVALIKDGYDG